MIGIVDVTDPQSFRIGQFLKKLGHEVVYPARHGKPHKLTRHQVLGVFGRIDFTRRQFELLDVPVPTPLPMFAPDDFDRYRRGVVAGTIGDVRKVLQDARFSKTAHQELFVKPRSELKAFNGRLTSLNDGWLNERENWEEVWVSGPVQFRHEWRLLVCKNEVLAAPCYSEFCRELKDEELNRARAWLVPGLDGYSLDVGYANSGEGLCVVEYNDGWSLGGYHEDEALVAVVAARFRQLANG